MLQNVDPYVHQQVKKYERNLAVLAAKVPLAKTIPELQRLASEVSAQTPSVLRMVTGSLPSHQTTVASLERRALDVVDAEVKALASMKDLDEKQFTAAAGEFIQRVRNPCRGYYPRAYNEADRGLLSIRRQRALENKSQESEVDQLAEWIIPRG